MKILKKIGWFTVSMLAALLSVVLQLGCGVAVMVIYALAEIAKEPGVVSYDEIMSQIYYFYMDNITYILILYQIVALLIFGSWYYFAYGRKKRPANAEKPNAQNLAVIVGLGICIELFVSGVLDIIYLLNPDLLQSYIELMEAAGITELTVATFVATVIMAPIGEELLCRGIIFRIAGKVSKRFWVANCIQALAFGVIHGNLVQGTYAFFIGLVLGYIYGKYRNIWVCMLLHGVVNLTSNFVDSYYGLFPEGYEMAVFIGNVLVTCALMAACFKALGKRAVLDNSGESLAVKKAEQEF